MGAKVGGGGADLRLGSLEDGITMMFFPITFIVHNHKSNGGGFHVPLAPPPIVTPLLNGAVYYFHMF